jgi:RNA polymerase sigma-70 factor (ECF subfamily)
MHEELSDQELIASSIVHPDHFGVVFDRHYDEIRRFVWRRLGPDHADDLAAEAFARAFKARGSFDPGCDDARPWVYGIANNLIRMHARSEGRRIRAYSKAKELPGEEFASEAVQRASAESARPELFRGLRKLSARDREIVLMHAWGDLNSREIGLALGLPDATVRTRLSRARKKLADGLPPQPHEPDLVATPVPVEGVER